MRAAPLLALGLCLSLAAGRAAADAPLWTAVEDSTLESMRGGFDFDQFKPLFPLFSLSLVVSTFAAVRERTSRRVALSMALLVGLLPLWAALRVPGGGWAAVAACAAILGVSLLAAAALTALQAPRSRRPRP